MTKKDLDYFKRDAEEDYAKTPISVLRYITELEEKFKHPVYNILIHMFAGIGIGHMILSLIK